ncbi:MAG: signal recognition particle-docking protein FtsY [Cyanobacteria bacterium]|nr:signal recognition particle-docking protein FtsY [Cyanobacteriota bacterium]
MVFDWFKRAAVPQAPATASPEAPAPRSPEPPAPAEPDLSQGPLGEAAASGAVPSEPSAAPSGTAADQPPAVGAVNQEALDWARQAYARLKAQQEQARLAAAAQSAPAIPVEPPAVVEPQLAVGTVAQVPAPPAAPSPAGFPPEPPAARGLSLLEQAAAERQQRLQQLTAATQASEPEPKPAAAASPVQAESEPQLGEFDDTFTWSAEVLAAQGRQVEDMSLEEIDWLGRLRNGLEKTRRGFVTQLLENLGEDPLTPEVLDDLETTLLRADVGVKATDQVLDALRRRLNEEVVDPAEGLRFLKEQLRGLLEAPIAASASPLLAPQKDRLNIWLMVGVNGVGKTTTLGKLANLAVRSGYSCLIAAADTFRAAAVEQVSIWGQRSGVAVIANPTANADPAAVVYDAIGAARAKGIELLLVDTAGRLQTKHNLMEELTKVRRIIDKLAPEAVVESLLVLDASQGQNGLRQAMAFASAAGLTGVVITKLDGSARGGVALAVASEAGLPIRFIGAGEGIRDLRPFNSFEFVEALLSS